jgi:CheY-like chemotaxis protein
MWHSFVAAYIGLHSPTMNHDTHTQRVILVDDCDNDNFFHDIALRKCGFDGEIKIYGKGEDALEFLLRDRVSVPTLVFMDINMAGMGGFELARTLDDMLEPGVPLQLHMLTSSSWAVDKAMCESIGCIKSYQVKPLTRETAAALIDMP